MPKTDKKDLEFLGQEFQYKLIQAFMDDKSFFKDLYNILDQNMFTDPNLRTYVGVMKDFYENEEVVPSYEMMTILLREKAHSSVEKEMFEATIKKVQETQSDGVDYIRTLARKFFKQQNIIKTANEILRIAGNGDVEKYEECVDLLNDALNQGNHDELGSSVYDDIGETLSDDYRTPIPTGIGKLDEALEGGLGKGELGVIIGSSGFGKVQPNDALIVTPSGYRHMGDIKVGDYVIGKNGEPTKVIGVYPHKDWEFYKVTFSDGVSCECGKEHLWSVNSSVDGDDNFKTLSLGEIMDEGLYDNENKPKFRIPMADPIEFNEINVKINPYLLGGIITDNKIKKILSLKSKDFESELLKYYGDDFFGGDLYIPDDYLYNSIENRLLLLNGLMDSFGNCDEDGNCLFRTKSERMSYTFKQLILSLGGHLLSENSWMNYDNNITTYEIKFNFHDIFIPIFSIEEKKNRFRYDDKFNRYFHNIEKSRVCNGQCIKVEAEDELYLTNDFIVTHNTSLTTAMSSHAATYKCSQNNYQGFKVLQIVFEDRIKQIQRKHIGRITGIEAKDLSKPENIDKVREILSKYEDKELLRNNLKIVRFPSGEITANQIRRFIKKLINGGFKPDMVVCDYFECLCHEGSPNASNEYEKEGKTMRKFEAMAGEFDIAFWVPCQGTKDSLNAELVTMDKMGGSVKKAQIAHIIMSIARSVEDIESNKATIALLKNRAGKSGKVFNNVEFNNGTCRISTDNVDEYENAMVFNKNQIKEKMNLQKEIFRQTVK